MNWTQLKWRIKFYSQYFPFTVNTFLCTIAIWGGYKVLYRPVPKDEPAPFLPFILLMGKVILWFLVVTIGLSVLSTFFSWLYYIWLKKNKHNILQVEFKTETKKGRTNKLYLNTMLEGAFRPILGFVKGRLFYDDNIMTDRFSLLSNKRKPNSILPFAISGSSRINLPDIKEYGLKGGFIYFQDMLHLFSLAVSQPISGQFYQPPVLEEEEDRSVFPKKTLTTDVRIEQLRRVEGEYLNYKDFEAGDDVRRIVWKVYAKNRELVVRVPEMYEPYASHLFFYASFHVALKKNLLTDGYLKEMLNYYKNNIWTVYDTLAKKEWQLRYVPDQTFNISEQLSEDEKDMRIISNSSWQTEKSINQYFNHKQGTVLCISSLTDIGELKDLLDQCDASTVVYFVKLSRVFKHFVAWNWLKRLILLPPEDRLSKLRSKWVFSPLRFQIQKREKEIENILNKSTVTSAIL